MSTHRKGNYIYYSDVSKCTGTQTWCYDPLMGWFVEVIVVKGGNEILQQILIEPYTKKEFRDLIDKGGIK